MLLPERKLSLSLDVLNESSEVGNTDFEPGHNLGGIAT